MHVHKRINEIDTRMKLPVVHLAEKVDYTNLARADNTYSAPDQSADSDNNPDFTDKRIG